MMPPIMMIQARSDSTTDLVLSFIFPPHPKIFYQKTSLNANPQEIAASLPQKPCHESGLWFKGSGGDIGKTMECFFIFLILDVCDNKLFILCHF